MNRFKDGLRNNQRHARFARPLVHGLTTGVLSCLLVFGLVACTGVSEPARSPRGNAEEREQKLLILQLTEHEPLVHRVHYEKSIFDESMTPEIVRQSIEADLAALERHLGAFEKEIHIKLLRQVSRPGEALARGEYWTGRVVYSVKGPTVLELRSDKLLRQSDLRFYLALARMHEMHETPKHLLLTIGVAHYCRADDGYDEQSQGILKRNSMLDPREEVDSKRLQDDPRYRAQVRGTSWATVYALQKKQKLTLQQILELTPGTVPPLNGALEQLQTSGKLAP